MIPSRTWFPLSAQERAAWFQNFASQFQAVAIGLGFLPAVVSAVAADNDDMQFCASSAVEIAAYSDACRQYRITLTDGDIGDPTPGFPVNPSLNPPAQVATGIFERLDSLVKQIRTKPTYTSEIGALLGIIPSPAPNIPVEDLKPVIKAGPSNSLFRFDLNVTRMGMSGFNVEIQRAGTTAWEHVGFWDKNPAVVKITPTIPNQPERILVRAMLFNNNENVGIPSDPTYVTVNP